MCVCGAGRGVAISVSVDVSVELSGVASVQRRCPSLLLSPFPSRHPFVMPVHSSCCSAVLTSALWCCGDAVAAEQVPELSLEYGKQLEFRGDYGAALVKYQEASRSLPRSSGDDSKIAALHAAATAGLTRCVLRPRRLHR